MHVWMHTTLVLGTQGGEKRVSDPLETSVIDNCELLTGCLELNPGPLKGHSVLLTTDPFLKAHLNTFGGYKEVFKNFIRMAVLLTICLRTMCM